MHEKINIPTVLVAPLDWGLGHTTRCIPIIRKLQLNGCKVIVAAEGSALWVLQQEFPGIDHLVLRGYRINYSRYKRFLPLKILWQLPKIRSAIQTEHRWLQRVVTQQRIDLVISDNRYGLWHTVVPSVLVTHQLEIQTPNAWLTRLVQRLHYRFIQRFHTCWVPDAAGAYNIAGRLSHPAVLPAVPVYYTGVLSRLQPVPATTQHYRWLMVISGPEPQRSLLEERLITLCQDLPGTVLLVRGKPGETTLPVVPGNCTVVNHLPTAQMQEAFASCDFVVSRSGYTTVMELLYLQKKSVLVPTPGQTEQEYLAQHLQQQHWCYSCAQHELTAAQLLHATTFAYRLPVFTETGLDEAIQAMPWDNQKTRNASPPAQNPPSYQ